MSRRDRKNAAAAFPYEERARAVGAAMREIKRTFQAMRDSGAGRRDDTSPSVAAWKAAIATFHAAFGRAFPPGFRDAYEAMRAGDPTAAEAAIAFLEADPLFFRSGYMKTKLIAALGRVALDAGRVERLRQVILNLVDRRDDREFRRYCRMAVRYDAPHLREALRARLVLDDPHVRRRAGWVLDALDRAAPRDRKT